MDKHGSIRSFFDKAPARVRNNTGKVIVIDDVVTEKEPLPLPQPAVRVKRCEKFETLEKRLLSLKKNKVEGDWRRHEVLSVAIPWTEVIQTFEHTPSKEKVEIGHFVPFGMKHYIEKQKSLNICIASYNALPKEVRDEMGGRLFTAQTYKKEEMLLTTHNTGRMAAKKFWRVWCHFCELEVLPQVLRKFADVLGENATFVDLLNSWDTLPSKKNDGLAKYVEVIGCFLPNPPNDNRLSPGPNYRKFLERAYEHVRQSHPHTQPKLSTAAKKRKSGITQVLMNSSSSSVTPPKLVIVEKPSSSKKCPSNQKTLTTKFSKKIPYMPITHYTLGERKSLLEKSQYANERFGKTHCLMMVHSGVNKKLSNEAIFEMYDVSMTGMETHFQFTQQCFKNEQIAGAMEVLQPPIRYALNKDTIYNCVSAITKSYKERPDSVYSLIEDALFWGISHDAIIKFGVDYLGVFIQATDIQNIVPIIAPQQLMEIKGGHTAVDIANYIIDAIITHVSLKGSAYYRIESLLKERDDDYDPAVKPPNYFKLGTVQKVDFEQKKIFIDLKNMPVANTGDGVASNVKASRLLSRCYGLQTPSYHCATHGTDLVLKRMATFKAKSIPEVVTAYEALRPVVKHFEKSTKSKQKLDEAIGILDLQKIKLINWGGTRMAHFVTACHKFSKLLPSVHDAMYSTDIKREERDALFTVENICVIILISDLKPFFKDGLLRAMDKTELLASTVFNKAVKAADNFKTLKTNTFDRFIEDLSFDSNGNLWGKMTLKENVHTFIFNRQSRTRRNVSTEEELENIKRKLANLKASVMKNAEENLRDLVAKESTTFHMWSGLDLSDGSSIEERSLKLKPLLIMFCNDTIHQVLNINELAKNENVEQEDTWQGYSIYLNHPRRLFKSPDEVEDEFKRAWPILGRYWLTHAARMMNAKKEANQREVLTAFCQKHGTEFPNISLLIQIMIATPSNSSPIERSYSMLEMICSKRRNPLTPKHTELLYILTALKLDVWKIEQYLDCLKYLESDIAV